LAIVMVGATVPTRDSHPEVGQLVPSEIRMATVVAQA
jgi:hypothetical protein